MFYFVPWFCSVLFWLWFCQHMIFAYMQRISWLAWKVKTHGTKNPCETFMFISGGFFLMTFLFFLSRIILEPGGFKWEYLSQCKYLSIFSILLNICIYQSACWTTKTSSKENCCTCLVLRKCSYNKSLPLFMQSSWVDSLLRGKPSIRKTLYNNGNRIQRD